jgi:hypothetical protein
MLPVPMMPILSLRCVNGIGSVDGVMPDGVYGRTSGVSTTNHHFPYCMDLQKYSEMYTAWTIAGVVFVAAFPCGANSN